MSWRTELPRLSALHAVCALDGRRFPPPAATEQNYMTAFPVDILRLLRGLFLTETLAGHPEVPKEKMEASANVHKEGATAASI